MAYRPVIFEDTSGMNRQFAQSLRQGMNITPAGPVEDNFDRYYSVYPDNEMEDLKMYTFFVRPQLNIIAGPGQPSKYGLVPQAYNNPVSRYIWETSPECIHYVSRWSKYYHHFIPYFTGRVESIQIADFTLRTSLTQNQSSWYQMPYAQSGTDSSSGGSFDVTFREDRHLRILNTHRVWIDYIHFVTYGSLDPFMNPGNLTTGPIGENRIDYAGSVYNFAVRPEGNEIVWWDKYTGIFPTNIPDSTFSFNRGSEIEKNLTISYAFFYHNPPCDPCIFGDFNYNAQMTGIPASNYDAFYVGAGNGIVGTPFVGRSRRNGKFYLYFTDLGYSRATNVSSPTSSSKSYGRYTTETGAGTQFVSRQINSFI